MIRTRHPLSFDPSRTGGIRRRAAARIRARTDGLAAAVRKLLVTDDAFGLRPLPSLYGPAKPPGSDPTVNAGTDWRGMSDADKIKAFSAWVRSRLGAKGAGLTDRQLWEEYVRAGFRQGWGRAWDQTKGASARPPQTADDVAGGYYAGARDQFLQSAFQRPVTAETLEALVTRALEESTQLTEAAAVKAVRTLADGLVRGDGPRRIAADLVKGLDVTRARAELIARTEIVRAHAEGQLSGLETLGVTRVGVEVEWTVTPDARVCPRCRAMAGTVLSVDDARGRIPLHPNCRCAWIPAGPGLSLPGPASAVSAPRKRGK